MPDYIDDDNLWKEDLFATLDVSPDVSDGELKKSYLKLAKKYHPDKYIDDEAGKLEAQRIFSKVTVAYNTLIDPQKKAHYLELRRLLANHLPENNVSPAPQQATPTNTNSPNSEAPKPNTPPKIDETQGAEKVKEEQARSFYDLGIANMRKKQVDKAIDNFKQAISIKTDVAEFHSQLGLAYKEKNWASMAQAEFKLAIKYNPKDKNAIANLSPADLVKNKKTEEKKGGLFGGLFNFGKKK